MKKLIVGLLAAFLMTSGLVAFSSTTASAACPYNGCFDTQTRTTGINVVGNRATINVTVDALGTNRNPQGTVKFVIKSDDFYQSGKEILSNGRANFTTRPLAPGRYSVQARYIKRPDSPFNKSAGGTRFFTIR